MQIWVSPSKWPSPGLNLRQEAGMTRTSGTVTDQPELHGVLRQVFDLGLQIVSVWISASPID
jgi:hypothetical protein